MPCYDGGYPENSKPIPVTDKRMESLLCSACRVLERMHYDFDENPALSEWWDAHKEADAKRRDEEFKRQSLDTFHKIVIKTAVTKKISELSEEERKILKMHGYL